MVAFQKDSGPGRARARAARADFMGAFSAARVCVSRAMRRSQPPGGHARSGGAREITQQIHGAKYSPGLERAVRRRIRTDEDRKLTPTISAYCNEVRAREV